MTVSALQVMVSYLRQCPELLSFCGERIAAGRHHFGGSDSDWPIPAKAVIVNYAGGRADIDVAVDNVRLEVRSYGETLWQAERVRLAVRAWCHRQNRFEVLVEEGRALVHALLQEAGPLVLHDPDIGMDCVIDFYRLMLAEEV